MCAIAKLIWHEYIFTAIFFDLLSSADFEFVKFFTVLAVTVVGGRGAHQHHHQFHSLLRAGFFCVRKVETILFSLVIFQIFHNHVLIAFFSLKCAINGSLNLQRCGSLTVEHIQFISHRHSQMVFAFWRKKFDYIISSDKNIEKSPEKARFAPLFI